MENLTILERANLNWSVESRPLVTGGENPIETNHIAIVRTDTNKILGVHSKGYEAFQNSQMGELLERISGKMDLPLHKGGYFGDGQKTYIQLKTTDKRLGTDLVKGYLTCVNSFDGSTSLGFGHSNLTISCQNTFFANYKQMENKVRHTASMMAKVDAICMQIEEVLRSESAIFNKIEKRNQLGYTLGASITDVLIPYLTIGTEYTRVNPFVYNNLIPAQTYTSYGFSLGDWMGNNFDRAIVYARYNPLPKLQLYGRIQKIRK